MKEERPPRVTDAQIAYLIVIAIIVLGVWNGLQR